MKPGDQVTPARRQPNLKGSLRRMARRIAACVLRRPRESDLFGSTMRETARVIYRATRHSPSAKSSDNIVFAVEGQ